MHLKQVNCSLSSICQYVMLHLSLTVQGIYPGYRLRKKKDDKRKKSAQYKHTFIQCKVT